MADVGNKLKHTTATTNVENIVRLFVQIMLIIEIPPFRLRTGPFLLIPFKMPCRKPPSLI